MKASVSIVYCSDYSQENLSDALRKLTTTNPLPELNGKKVLLKPNILSDAKPENCITTNPEFVRAVIRLVKDKGAAEVLVGDSPGIPGASFCGENCGINRVCREEKAVWVNFSDNPENTLIKGTNQTLPLASVLKDVDFVFSLSKMKTHQLMYSTGCVKNLFGLIPGLHKSPCHLSNPTRESFAKLIVGICETVKPSYNFMDAVIAMEGPGPANGNPKAVNLILSSDNPYAIDYAQSVIMGYNPEDIPILAEAKKRNLLPSEISYPLLDASSSAVKDYKTIEIRKKTKFFSTLIVPFFTKGIQKRQQKKNPAPSFNSQKCIGCLKCVKICPAHVLSYDSKTKISIDTKKCLRCYCCHEMCQQDAISIGVENK